MTQEIRFEPGYDYITNPTPEYGPEYGKHGMTIRFLLHGEEGTVQFVMYTDWLPSDVDPDADWGPRVSRSNRGMESLYPMAADLGRHWDSPRYDPESEPIRSCDVRPSGECYYDGSGLNAEPVMAALFTKGSEAVWEALRDYYSELCEQTASTP